MKAPFGFLLLIWLSAQFGQLVIKAPIGAIVIWDGSEIGTISDSGQLILEAIPPGDYRVLLRRESRILLDQTVRVRPGIQKLEAVDSVPVLRPVPASREISPPPAREPSADQSVSPRMEQTESAAPAPRRPVPSPEQPVQELRSSELAASEKGSGWLMAVPFLAVIFLLILVWRGKLAANLSREEEPLKDDGTAGKENRTSFPAVPDLEISEGLAKSSFLDDLRRREEETDRSPNKDGSRQRALTSPLEVEIILSDEGRSDG